MNPICWALNAPRAPTSMLDAKLLDVESKSSFEDAVTKARNSVVGCCAWIASARLCKCAAFRTTPNLQHHQLSSQHAKANKRPIYAEISLKRRVAFLREGSPDAVYVPGLRGDLQREARAKQVVSMDQAPISGQWRGKIFDGFAWVEADWTLFFQDRFAIDRSSGKQSKGYSSLEMMGTCCPVGKTGHAQDVPVIGNYNPDVARLAWSQPPPPPPDKHTGVDLQFNANNGAPETWEVWLQFYSSTNCKVQEVDRAIGSWKDSSGRQGNIELYLCEGDVERDYLVANSFWDRTGSDLFVLEDHPVINQNCVDLQSGKDGSSKKVVTFSNLN